MIDPKENILHFIPIKHIEKQVVESDSQKSSYLYIFLGGLIIAIFCMISKIDASKTKQYLEDMKNNIKETSLEYREWMNYWKDRSIYKMYVDNGAFKATKYNTDYFESIYSFFIGFI